ncbi:hypothetical protein, partial [Alkalibacter mobilis]|uniref:hypothetical protein n=1 Tax=Alkalibacter mobilis TaxID=2787712 RepID=UPI001A9C2472
MIKIFRYIFTIVFPIIRIFGFPFPMIFFVIPFIRFDKYNKNLFYIGLFSSFYLLIVLVLNNNENVSIGSLMYSILPMIYVFLISIFTKMSGHIKILKSYFYINIIIVFFSGVLNYIPKFLEIYYNSYLFGNITSSSHYMVFIANRSIGLLGHPAWLGL